MLRPSSLALSVVCVFSLATAGQAFTLIPLSPFNTVEKMSTGFPSANRPSGTATKPRYSVDDSGCFVVFTSDATNLTATEADGNGQTDVFLYESCGVNKVTLVSHVSTNPDKAAGGLSDQPVISPDSGFVVFRSTAPDIVPETPHAPPSHYTGQTNVFVWNRVNDTFQLASHKNGDNKEPGDGDSLNGVISRGAGQTYVAFESIATNINDSDNKSVNDIFRYALGSGGVPVDLVSFPNGGGSENGDSFNPAIDSSGSCIVYESTATNLVSTTLSDDVNVTGRDIFVWGSGGPATTILLSHRAGAPAFGAGALTGSDESTEPSVDDGCTGFAFKSLAKDLAPGQNENNGGNDVFWADNRGDDARLVSHPNGATKDTGSDVSDAPILSRNGDWIAYASRAKDLALQNDNGASSDVFAYDVGGDKNILVSHTAKDPSTVASGESFAPEISTTGLYVAYESEAKDLDPNQNDGNGARDVYLYNTLWNDSIVASPRYASIAITGNRQSDRPALSGNGYAVAFTGLSNNHIADDPEAAGIPDVFLFKAANLPPFISVRSTNTTNVVQVITNPVNYVSLQASVHATSPCSAIPFSDPGWAPLGGAIPPANASGVFTDPNIYAPGTVRCYGIFVQRDGVGSILPGATPTRTMSARTVDDTTGPVKWASNLAGTTALTQVGIGTQNLIAVANDGGVYGLSRGPSGGLWPSAYWPFRTTFSPIQGRPPILSLSVLGSTRTTFVGSQDGRAYAFDADRGARAGGALWYTTPKLGDLVQPGASGWFTLFGGLADDVLIGARTGALATFYALDALSGAPRAAFSGTANIGAINTAASVDYVQKRVYFASLESGGGQPSLWCLNLTATGFGTPCWSPSILPAGISGGPVQRNGKVYVGDDNGQVWAFDAAAGGSAWAGPFIGCGGGNPIKSFVLADRQPPAQDLYYSAGSFVCALTDQGASPISKWVGPVTTIPSPSAPTIARIGASVYLYVGASNGRLYQIDTANPLAPGAIKSVLVAPGSTIGPPAFDVLDNMVYVGTLGGVIYAVQAPLP